MIKVTATKTAYPGQIRSGDEFTCNQTGDIYRVILAMSRNYILLLHTVTRSTIAISLDNPTTQED